MYSMYYQFAILHLFRPFITLSISGSSLSPRDTCFEAANTISALLQSYSQLYTLRRTPSFIPLFILTSSILHLSIGPTLSLPITRLQSQQLLASQVTGAILQAVTDLDAMAPCHRSAKGAHYLINALAKKNTLIIPTHLALDIDGAPLAVGTGSVNLASTVLEEELQSKWDYEAGRFIGFSRKSEAIVQDFQNPPFWLIYKQALQRSLHQSNLESMGFCV